MTREHPTAAGSAKAHSSPPAPPVPDASTAQASPSVTNSTVSSPPGGLQILDTVVGEGEEARTRDKVRVHYVGRLTNGTIFDSSRDRGQPFDFTLGAGEVIAGWDHGVVGMREGGKRRLVIPPEQAYGSAGAPPAIPKNATLIFEVELVRVLSR